MTRPPQIGPGCDNGFQTDSRGAGQTDVFDYIEACYNRRIRRSSQLGQLSPYDFEQAALSRA